MIARRVLPLLLALTGCGGGREAGVRATGTVEATEVDIAPLTAGRLVELRFREGDTVRAGDTVAVLARGEVAGELDAARARVSAVEAGLRQLEAGSRREDVEAARAQLAGAEGDLRLATRELDRVRSLVRQELVTPQEVERAEAVLTRARSQREVARRALERLQRGARSEEIDAARAELEAARAAYAQARGAAGELVLTSPLGGVVLLRAFEPGEVVPAAASVLVVVDPRDLWMRVYVGQQDVARLRVGQRAEVTLDAAPGRVFEGRVVEISPRAEFTPRVALTETERADLVFGVRLALRDGAGLLKPGLPAEARIDLPAAPTRQ